MLDLALESWALRKLKDMGFLLSKVQINAHISPSCLEDIFLGKTF